MTGASDLPATAPVAEPSADVEASRSQIRGSSLLLVGRIVALGLAFVTQVLTVRYLSREAYGAFAYALSIVSFGETLSLLGFDRGVARFIPIYDERDERPEALGVVLIVVSTIIGLGTAFVLVLVGFSSTLTGGLGGAPSAPLVLSLLAALGPLHAFDRLGTSLLAIYTRPRAIFFRKYLLGPGLQLLAVIAVVGVGGGVVAMSVGYLVSGIIGVLLYAVILVRVLRQSGRLRGTSLRTARLPWRKLLTFSIPLLTTDLVFATMTSLDGVMLGAMRGADEVAALRAVQPVARLNQLVMTSFGVLFTPVAARLFARGDTPGINRLYWRTATWVAVLSFPVFAVTFTLSRPLAPALFGAAYADAGTILGLFSVGFYATAALGFNGMVLNVYGRVRDAVTVNLAAAGTNIALNLVLIPLDGARGAATATMVTLIVHNVLKQVAMRRGTDVDPLDRDYLQPYLVILTGAAVLIGLRVVLDPGVTVGLVAAVVVALVVLLATRRSLEMADTFPELARIPVVGALLRGRR